MIPVVARNVREIPVGLIDDPEIAMRDTFDDEAFRELVQSIAVNGIQVPLIVEQRGGRYRVSAGHRRITAARVLEAVTVPCDVRQPGELDAEAIKILENDDREEVNAGDAALYLQRLFVEKCGHDVDQVCALTKRTRRYVEDRLLLLEGDPEILEALKARRIAFGVAKELNQVKDLGYRRLHLENALKYGMTIAAAKDARKQSNFALDQGAKLADTSTASSAGVEVAQPSAYVCYICQRGDHVERMRYVMVHEHCDLAIGQRVLAGFRESDPVSELPNA